MKRILLSLAASLAVGALWAAPLTPDQALQRLQDNGMSTRSMALPASPQLKLTQKTRTGEPALYVFDNSDKGYIVVSADDATLPLLGFSDSGSFDPDNIPPALEGWLNSYQEQIEYARENGLNSRASLPMPQLPAWTPIGPLVKTTWDQGTPYNNKCPKINNVACATGCVATAMSQVMNYFQYPEMGKGSIAYQFPVGTMSQTCSFNFAATTFDWSNMLDSYSGKYTQTEADAVATLMAAAGASVKMYYGTSQSGTPSNLIPGALVQYFGYDAGVKYVSRGQKSYTEWATLIYNNLKNVGPVIYDGDTAFLGGHSFVCDGYNGDGYFHFNWGWSGMSDGYYLLDALNPPALGTGGAEGGFNFRQDVILNIQKPKAGSQPTPDEIVLSGSLYGYNNSTYLYLGINSNEYTGFIYQGNYNSVSFALGAMVEEVDNPSAAPQYIQVANSSFQNCVLEQGNLIYCTGAGQYPFPMFKLSNINFKENVKYKVTPVYQLKGSNVWQPTEASVGYYNYFYITSTSSGYVYENFDVMEFDCTEFKQTGDLYEGIAAQLSITLVNDNDIELTRGVILMLLDSNDKAVYYGDSMALTLSPGESYSWDWTSPLTQRTTGKGPYYWALYDLDSDTYYYKSTEAVTMQPNPGAPTVVASVAIDNAEMKDNIYQVENSQDMVIKTNFYVISGILSTDYSIYIMQQQGNDLVSVSSYPLETVVVNEGQTYTYETPVNFNTASVGGTYYVVLGEIVNKNLQPVVDPVPFKVLGNFAGIDSVELGQEEIMFVYNKNFNSLNILGGNDGIASVEAYYLNGMKAPMELNRLGDSVSADLSALGKGVIVVVATDNAGNRKSLKLAL